MDWKPVIKLCCVISCFLLYWWLWKELTEDQLYSSSRISQVYNQTYDILQEKSKAVEVQSASIEHKITNKLISHQVKDDSAWELRNVVNISQLQPMQYLQNYRNPCWHHEGREQASLLCLPYFFFAGVAKCGTARIDLVLQMHHQIVPSRYKELEWWRQHRKLHQGLGNYTDKFKKATAIIGNTVVQQQNKYFNPVVTYDASPTTLYHPFDPFEWRKLSHDNGPKELPLHEIHHILPDARILLSLRNPTTRTFSDYMHFRHKSLSDFHANVVSMIRKWNICLQSFTLRKCTYFYLNREIHLPLAMSVYYIFISDWLKVWKRSQFHILKFEEYKVDEVAALTNVFKFLQLDPMNQDTKSRIIKNKAIHDNRYKLGAMWNETKILLDNFYRPYNKHLAKLLGSDKWLWLDNGQDDSSA